MIKLSKFGEEINLENIKDRNPPPLYKGFTEQNIGLETIKKIREKRYLEEKLIQQFSLLYFSTIFLHCVSNLNICNRLSGLQGIGEWELGGINRASACLSKSARECTITHSCNVMVL